MKLLSLEMSARLLSPSRAFKARDEHGATFSGDEHKWLLSPSRALKTRDKHEATFSGDEHKATLSLSFSQDKR